MKVIDLLNKIANGEEVPEKIKYLNRIYEYAVDIRDYEDDDYSYENLYDKYLTSRMFKNGNTEDMLNSKLEIIEEDKKIEKLNLCSHYGGTFEEEQVFRNNRDDKIVKKINEIIDYLEENK